jgi:hypothetical protein
LRYRRNCCVNTNVSGYQSETTYKIKMTNMLRQCLTILTLIILTINSNKLMAQKQTPEQIIQTNLDCYNNRDIDGFMTSFSNDITFYNYADNKPTAIGLEQVRKLYKELFDLSPNLHSTILRRITFDNKVIDHESIIGRRGSDEIFEIVLIYEVKGDKIFKVTAIRK